MCPFSCLNRWVNAIACFLPRWHDNLVPLWLPFALLLLLFAFGRLLAGARGLGKVRLRVRLGSVADWELGRGWPLFGIRSDCRSRLRLDCLRLVALIYSFPVSFGLSVSPAALVLLLFTPIWHKYSLSWLVNICRSLRDKFTLFFIVRMSLCLFGLSFSKGFSFCDWRLQLIPSWRPLWILFLKLGIFVSKIQLWYTLLGFLWAWNLL